jgi:glycosyltransferase involved in cell wall biosynthesis
MKILVIHNLHRSGSASGDDGVYSREAALLEKMGHKVIRYTLSNDEFDRKGSLGKTSVAFQIPWSMTSARTILDIVRKERPGVAHVHNFFPLLSPSIYYTLKAEGVRVVQTLHDFRFMCANAFFMRDGLICEDCKGGPSLRSVKYGCFKESRLQTIPVAAMIKLHSMRGTFRRKIDTYICLTDFQRDIFGGAGFERAKLVVKPNFVEDRTSGVAKAGEYAIFVGRLGEEKGVRTLIEAWKNLPEIPLKIVGDGPDAAAFRALASARNAENVEFLGYLSNTECMKILSSARFLVMPSIWHETFGLTAVEAFSCGKPVIASNLGGMADIVDDGRTGFLFAPGDPADLAQKVSELWNDPRGCEAMGRAARQEYEEKYTPERNYEMLMSIYSDVIAGSKGNS